LLPSTKKMNMFSPFHPLRANRAPFLRFVKAEPKSNVESFIVVINYPIQFSKNQ